MSLLVIAAVVAGVVIAALLISSRRARPVLLPILLVAGVAALSFAVTWDKEQERRAREAANAANDRETATLMREPNLPVSQAPLPPAQPPFIVPSPSPLLKPATGAAAPPAVPPPTRNGGAS